jgi:hypothetical protein
LDLIVKVNNQTVNYARNSIDVDDAIGQRSTASFVVIDREGTMRFKKGQQVEIFQEVAANTGDYATWDNDDLTNNWEG